MLLHLLASLAFGQQVTEAEIPALNAQTWRPPVDARYTLWTDDAGLAAHGATGGQLSFGYVDRPIRYVFDEGDRAGDELQLLHRALHANAVGHVTLWRVRLGLDVPVYWGNSDVLSGQVGVGDVAGDLKAVILDGRDAPLGLALGSRLTVPTASLDVPLGYDGFTWDLQAIADKRVGDVFLAANLGTRGVPAVELENARFGDQFFYRLGGAWLISERGGASLDLAGNVHYAEGFNRETTPLEALVGGWGQLASGLFVKGGVGAGLTDGIGAAAFRSVFTLAYQPPAGPGDRDQDGLTDDLDRCVDEPEDHDGWFDDDGCPDLDNDADGLADVDDACPDAPEDFDDWQDADGCPDPASQVTIRFVDPDGRPVHATVLLGGEVVDEVIDAYTSVRLHPGFYDLVGRADGYAPFSATFEVPDPDPLEVVEVMQPEIRLGTVRLSVVGPDREPVAATWRLGDGGPRDVDGTAEATTPPGEFTVLVEADGYGTETVDVSVAADEVADLEVQLRPTRVHLVREKIEISEKVFFDTGKSTIKAESHPLLDEVAQVLLDHPELTRVRIEGHTDSRGSDAYNLDLSRRRAAAVRQHLVDAGVEPERLVSVGFGEERPLDERENPVAWERNRRVDFYVERRAPAASQVTSTGGHHE